MKYTGEPCSKCGSIFNEDDDVVVCPQCGSPHHRKCYEADNACANTAKHSEGFKWSPLNAAKTKDKVRTAIFCPYCGTETDSFNAVCPNCGNPLKEQNTENGRTAQENAFKMAFGIDRNTKIDGISAEELLYFIKSNSLYYLPLFRHIAETGKKISFNLLCFIFPPIFFANRRMWLWAILTATVSVLLAVPLTISYLAEMSMTYNSAAFFSQTVIDILSANSNILTAAIEICNVLDFAMRILLCLFGNWLYYRFAVNTIRKLKERKGTTELTNNDLINAGGVRVINMLLISLITFAFTFGAMTLSQIILETLF